MQTARSSTSTTSTEVETLKTRIASLEAANRDALAVIESKSTANDSMALDLQKQHQKTLELGQQIASLQQSAQSAESAAASARFREQSLAQELELAKRNNDWFEAELKTKAADALKFRKEKGARISELQRLNDDANSTLEALKRTEQTLRSRLEAAQKKAEDSLCKIQQLQETAATAEEGFRQELESSRRLAELHAQQSETHRNRITEIEAEQEKVKDDAAEEIGRCQQAVDEERQGREQAEHRISELEAEIDRFQSMAPATPQAPSTPRPGLNGSVLGQASPGPFGTPGSVRGKLTATQLTHELHATKGELRRLQREYANLEAANDEIMRGVEAKGPEFQEQQEELERLQHESIEMSQFLDQLSRERDQAKKDAKRAEGEAANAKAESNILRQQLRDLSAQIKLLVYDLNARERGLDALSSEERTLLERLARGEVEEDALEGMTDSDQFISQRLTVFRSISELQEKNQELLKITRQLGAQMESEEALAAKHQAAQDHEEVESLRKRVEDFKDELRSMMTRSESYMKERDMFRRMLQHRGQLPPTSDLASLFGQSVDGNPLQSTEQGVNGRSSTNDAVLLREITSHFDQYREEASIDRRTLKEQITALSTEKNSLQAEIAKNSSHLSLANERFEMLQSNFVALQNENGELQKRTHALAETAAKQDLRTQQVAEDLIESRGMVESMRNETANLKAEKKLWKDIQDRLSQDVESLTNERNRLNGLLSNQQNLLNERQLADSEARRRLTAQVESLETELATTKRKLNDEIEDNRKAQLRKEYDTQQTQKRIDELVASLSQVREELVAAKTTRDHVQARVDELTIELRSAEERVVLLQPRPTPRGPAPTEARPAGEGAESNVDREQELAIEVSELKRDLELARSELDSAKEQIEQYKAISQAAEEDLQSLNATQDQYREEMDRVIEEKDAKIVEVQRRIEDISAELSTTNSELTTLRNQQSEVLRHHEDEKAALASEILTLKDDSERHATNAQFAQQDLRAQAAIATKAQQDYENELVKHADAARSLQNLRTEYNQVKTEAATYRTEVESIKLTLAQSETSWEERRKQFNQELDELRRRREDANTQNKLLQEQLDSLGSQITTLQQGRAGDANTLTAALDASSDRSADGLRELNAFLRREKEIVEVQYELKVQEAKRLQQKLEYAETQLDECRLKLDQERRQHADSNQSSMNHATLMEKLNELNLLRESNITLRNEARLAQSQLADKSQRVDELIAQIQPLESRVQELEHITETMKEEHRLLDEDRNHWQKRTEDILSKYDRIDPAEMEKLKETIETLRAERDVLQQDSAPMQQRVQTLEEEKAAWQINRQKIIDQAKERNRTLTKDKNDRAAERDAALQERDSLQQQLEPLQTQLAEAAQEKAAAEQRLEAITAELAGQREQQAQVEAPTVVDETLTQQLEDLRKSLNTVNAEKQQLEAQLATLRQELETANAQRDEALTAASQVQAPKDEQVAAADKPDDEVEDGQVKDDAPSLAHDERKALEERIAVAERLAQEKEQRAKELEDNMEMTIKTRSDKMKTILNKKLVESKEAQKAGIEAEYKLKFEQDKQIWLAEHQSQTASTAQTAAPAPVPEKVTAAEPVVPGPAKFDAASITDVQVRELLSTNATVKNIVTANIRQKLEKETQRIKEEQQKLVGELQQKAETEKAAAVLMMEKKSALKINMLDNRSKQATAKLAVVEKAATDTPEKPVGEVWAVAKLAKPPVGVPTTPIAALPSPIVTTMTSTSKPGMCVSLIDFID